jgi:hypothetical protein
MVILYLTMSPAQLFVAASKAVDSKHPTYNDVFLRIFVLHLVSIDWLTFGLRGGLRRWVNVRARLHGRITEM